MPSGRCGQDGRAPGQSAFVRPMTFRARQFRYQFPRPALVMGVINVTPDSFSDGGLHFDRANALEYALTLPALGAEILDIGGESTRPGATPVSEEEELRRVLPVIEVLAEKVTIPISIDTMKPAVARAALQAGASIVNDIAANRADDEMWRVVSEAEAGYICMHMQGTPQTMQTAPAYGDVVREVTDFFRDRLKRLNGCGVAADQVVLDPGIGFGKNLDHNLQLLAGLRSFTTLERPLLIGVSRKSFLGKLPGVDAAHRLSASLACACLAVESGVQIVRAHDVAETVQALRMTEAVLNRRK
jgi:dihydropteroate synthase